MIKLKELLSEEYRHPVYGSDTTNFLVKRPFDLFVKTGRLEPTGQYSTAGGIFLINRGRKKAYQIIHQKGGTGKKSNLQKVALSDIENYVDYDTWKNWLKK